MPALPHDSNIMFEIIMFVYTGTAVFLQFLHLYRSVWWLPNSNANHAMVIRVAVCVEPIHKHNFEKNLDLFVNRICTSLIHISSVLLLQFWSED